MVAARKTIVILLLCGFFTWLIYFTWVHLSYASHLPRSPNQQTGQTYRIVVNHGSVRYGTARNLRALEWAENSQLIAIAFAAIAMWLQMTYKDFNNKNRPSFS
jgi:hypothetical protein